MDERTLLNRCLEGDAIAWREFVNRYHSQIEGAVRYTYLRCLYCVPEPDVANVVQDLYISLYEDQFRRLRSFQGRCPFGLWLKSLAIRRTLNAIREQKRRGRFGGGDLEELRLHPGASPEVEDAAQVREDISRLEGLIEQLSPPQQTALKLFYFDGLPYRQIARILDVAPDTVGALISRGRSRLRTLLHRSG